jgi:hypothetical protein
MEAVAMSKEESGRERRQVTQRWPMLTLCRQADRNATATGLGALGVNGV